jgi:hypothetical protein
LNFKHRWPRSIRMYSPHRGTAIRPSNEGPHESHETAELPAENRLGVDPSTEPAVIEDPTGAACAGGKSKERRHPHPALALLVPPSPKSEAVDIGGHFAPVESSYQSRDGKMIQPIATSWRR